MDKEQLWVEGTTGRGTGASIEDEGESKDDDNKAVEEEEKDEGSADEEIEDDNMEVVDNGEDALLAAKAEGRDIQLSTDSTTMLESAKINTSHIRWQI